jgi:hypothetical protein
MLYEKLGNNADLTWTAVFIPLYIEYLFSAVCSAGFVLKYLNTKPAYLETKPLANLATRKENLQAHALLCFCHMVTATCWFAFIWGVEQRVDGDIHFKTMEKSAKNGYNTENVFFPLRIALLTHLVLISAFYRPYQPKQVVTVEAEGDGGPSVSGQLVVKQMTDFEAFSTAINQTLGLALLLWMLEWKIVYTGDLKWAVAFWPFWLAASTLLCFSCCGGCAACMMSADPSDDGATATTAEAKAMQKTLVSVLKSIAFALIPMAISAIIFLKYLSDELEGTASRGLKTVLLPLVMYKLFQLIMMVGLFYAIKPHHMIAMAPHAHTRLVDDDANAKKLHVIRHASSAGLHVLGGMSGQTHAQQHVAHHATIDQKFHCEEEGCTMKFTTELGYKTHLEVFHPSSSTGKAVAAGSINNPVSASGAPDAVDI